jgi:hypothetical protein
MAQGQRNRLRDQRKRRSRTAAGIDGSAGEGEWMAGDDRQRRPAEGLVGAHDQRRDPLVDGPDAGWLEQDRDDARFTAGAEVAPTARAARDQRQRHRAEGSSGRIAARVPGKKGRPRASARDARAASGVGVARAESPAGKRAGKAPGRSARGAGAANPPVRSRTTDKPSGKRRGRALAGLAGSSRGAGRADKKPGRAR